MKRLEENLPYLGSGSAAGIEALARLAAAGVEIGFNPEAMGGGGNDPLDDYFRRVEAGSADQIGKLFQWAEQEGLKGTKAVNCQGILLPLDDYRMRLEEIMDLKKQAVVIPISPKVTIKEEIEGGLEAERNAFRMRQEEQIRRLQELKPKEWSEYFKSLKAKAGPIKNAFIRSGIPQIMAEVAEYYGQNDISNIVPRWSIDGFSIESEDIEQLGQDVRRFIQENLQRLEPRPYWPGDSGEIMDPFGPLFGKKACFLLTARNNAGHITAEMAVYPDPNNPNIGKTPDPELIYIQAGSREVMVSSGFKSTKWVRLNNGSLGFDIKTPDFKSKAREYIIDLLRNGKDRDEGIQGFLESLSYSGEDTTYG